MENSDTPSAIKDVLYFLYYIENINNDPIVSEKQVVYLKNTYNKNELAEMYYAMDWGLRNTTYDFSGVLPNTRQSNPEILIYLRKMKKMFEDNDLGQPNTSG